MKRQPEGGFFAYAGKAADFIHRIFDKFGGEIHSVKKLKNGCLYPRIQYRLAHGLKMISVTFLHRTFAFVMNDKSTLLCLFLGMFAYLDKNLAYMLESIHVIIKNNQVILFGIHQVFQQYFQFFFLAMF